MPRTKTYFSIVPEFEKLAPGTSFIFTIRFQNSSGQESLFGGELELNCFYSIMLDYSELKTEIAEVKEDLGEVQTEIDGLTSELDQVKTDVDDARTDIDDVQERNHAFKYYVSSSSGAVKSSTTVNFDSRVYGEGVNNGIYTAPIGNDLIYYL